VIHARPLTDREKHRYRGGNEDEPKKARSTYWQMTADELRDATKEFDDEFVADKGRP